MEVLASLNASTAWLVKQGNTNKLYKLQKLF